MIFLGYGLQTYGLQSIPSSTSAFITALYVPLVPLLQWAAFRTRPSALALVGVALAFVGLLLVAGPQEGVALGAGSWRRSSAPCPSRRRSSSSGCSRDASTSAA
ncbi:EamA family transporter [Clavibacter zhangzhiyongii]|uniref:EamA family transporter n=1 Tax=Clavibacter zhangzhiyongii TaxID=2768071 RepID=UPI0039E10214